MDEQKPKTKIQNNNIYTAFLILATILFCGFSSFGLLGPSFTDDPGSSLTIDPVPAELLPYFAVQKILVWIGYFVALAVVILVILALKKNKGHEVNNTPDEFWTLLLIAVGISSTYFWIIFRLYYHMSNFDSTEEHLLPFILFVMTCPSLILIFPLLGIRLATRPKRKMLSWWIGLFLTFGAPIIAFVFFILLEVSFMKY